MRDAILSSYLEGFTDDFGYKNDDQAKQFELFASYCVVCHSYTDKFDAEKSVVGKGCDTGIDAIAILVNGKVCHDVAELDDFIHANNKIDVQFVFVQSKTSPSFECSEISIFGKGVKDFFRDFPTLRINEDIKKYRTMKDIVYKNARKFYDGNPSCAMYYVTTGKLELDKDLLSSKDDAISEIDHLGCLSKIELEYIDGNKLYKMYQGITRGTEKEIEMEHYIVLPEANDVEEALLGRISCKQFLKLICDDNGTIDQNIFSDNIRDYLGNSSVNEEIASSISNPAQRNYFILLNNGVTAVAKKVQRTKNNLIIDNIQIVNGCQTSNVIYKNKDFITDDMHLPIKIISTSNQEVINSIIRSTNRQNRVEPEAFESLSEFHRKFEEFCKAKNRNVTDNIYYERRSRQYVTDESIKPIEVITMSNVLSATLAMFFEEPHSTHRYYGELLKKNKGRIFSESHNMEPYYFFAYCFRKLTMELRRNNESKKHSIAKYHTLMYLWIVLTGGKKYQLNSRKLVDEINNKYLKIVDTRESFLSLCVKGTALFYRTAQNLPSVDRDNIARSRQITEKMISSIPKSDYVG